MKGESLYRKKERGDGMHFHSRKRSQKGIAGFVLSMVSVVLFLVLCILSAIAKGDAGAYVGGFGLLVMINCIFAFILSLQGLKERDVYVKLPFAGLLISGALFVFLFCLYILGI